MHSTNTISLAQKALVIYSILSNWAWRYDNLALRKRVTVEKAIQPYWVLNGCRIGFLIVMIPVMHKCKCVNLGKPSMICAGSVLQHTKLIELNSLRMITLKKHQASSLPGSRVLEMPSDMFKRSSNWCTQRPIWFRGKIVWNPTYWIRTWIYTPSQKQRLGQRKRTQFTWER